ncbi:hypothetical protein COOONC_26019, partial [Cooperia oncophora]
MQFFQAQAQLQFQQQQQQQAMMQQQPWSQPWAPQPPQPWPQPWVPQPPMWEQPHWDQPMMPQQTPPVVYFFNPMPQPQQQFQPQAPPPPPFQPPMMHQNQFPLPVQSEAPIMPQPFPVDNNNNVNAINENVMKPWYMSGDDQRWQQTWVNSNKVPLGILPLHENVKIRGPHRFLRFLSFKADTPFNPNPAAATSPFVDNTAVVEQQPVVPQPAPEQPMGHDSDGIDGFPREEKFNVPVDVASDAAPQTVDVAPEAPPQVDGVPAVNAWQHTQPEAAEEPM